jgi:phosphopantetheinyl transferase (holo-ACP synthase)
MSEFQKYENITIVAKETSKVLSNIPVLSRLQTFLEKPLKVIDAEKMNYITEKTQEINEKIYNFSKQNTQISHKLISLTLLFPADSVYRQLQQIAAQIEKTQQALLENIGKLKENQIELEQLNIKIKKIEKQLEEETDEHEKRILELEIDKLCFQKQQKQVGIANSFSYVEGAIKSIGYLTEAYEEIKKNKNVPDDWDEYDVEKEEIKTNIKNAFRNLLRDFLSAGRINVATAEYLEQMGISPLEAIKDVTDYINEANIIMNNGGAPDFDNMYDWLNAMADKYGECYKKMCERIGLNSDNLISKKFTLINGRNLKELTVGI